MINTTTAGGVQPSMVCSVYDQHNHCRRSSTIKGLQCLWSIQPLQEEFNLQMFVVFMIDTTTAGGVQPSRVCSVYDQYNHCRRSSTIKGLQCLWSIQPLQPSRVCSVYDQYNHLNLQGFVVFMINTTTRGGVQPSKVCCVYDQYNHCRRSSTIKGL